MLYCFALLSCRFYTYGLGLGSGLGLGYGGGLGLGWGSGLGAFGGLGGFGGGKGFGGKTFTCTYTYTLLNILIYILDKQYLVS
jgi:hypothetical protein